jgi:arylsulfatase A-like enzyme
LIPASLTAAGTVASRGAAASEPVRPNILIILTDDQRVHDTLGVMPQTRRLFERGGTRYPNGFVTTPLCCPSRSTIFSGRYAHNHGVTGQRSPTGPPPQPPEPDPRATMQRYLHDAGYRTAIAGKFLVNVPWSTSPPNWDRWAVTGGGYNDPWFNVDGDVRRLNGQYSTTVVGDETVRFLRGFDRTDDAAPWLMYVAPQAPHSTPHGHYVPEGRYRGAPVPHWNGNPAEREVDRSDKPPWVEGRTYDWATQGRRARAVQLRTLMSVDDQVARIYRTIDALGEQNTLAFFLSDNGFTWGEHGIGEEKRFPYTESVKVPFFARWPGHVAAGVVDRSLVANVDLLPTILRAAGLSPQLRYPLDGRSIFARGRRRLLLEYFVSPDDPVLRGWAGIRAHRYEYVEWFDDPARTDVVFREYYDLTKDPWELTNRYRDGRPGNNPPTVRLHRRLVHDMACAGATCP